MSRSAYSAIGSLLSIAVGVFVISQILSNNQPATESVTASTVPQATTDAPAPINTDVASAMAAGVYPTLQFPSFGQLAEHTVRERIVKDAVRDATAEDATPGRLLCRIPLITRFLYSLRQKTFDTAIGADWYDFYYDSLHMGKLDVTLNFRAWIMDGVREALKDPKTLEIYSQHLGPILLKSIGELKPRDHARLREELEQWSGIFNEKLLPETVKMQQDLQEAERCYSATTNQYANMFFNEWQCQNSIECHGPENEFLLWGEEVKAQHDKFVKWAGGEENLKILQWRLRRYAEGGKALDRMYGKILFDLLQSYPRQRF